MNKIKHKILILAVSALSCGNVFAADNIPISTEPENQMNDLQVFQNNMQSHFQNIFGGLMNEPMFVGSMASVPTVNADVSATKDEVEVKLDLPGANKETTDVRVYADKIVVAGTIQQKKDEKKKDYVLSERQSGSFQRVIPLPAEVDFENAKSEYKDGVLTIKIAKAEQQRPKFKKIDF